VVQAVAGWQNALPLLKVAQVYPGPQEFGVDGLHETEHQFRPMPSVKQVPVEQSEPRVQKRHRSEAPTCGRHANPAVEA
jgi:hypothetical protein